MENIQKRTILGFWPLPDNIALLRNEWYSKGYCLAFKMKDGKKEKLIPC